MSMRRYIATTGKIHEHRFVIAADLSVAELPLRDDSARQDGWVRRDGVPFWLGTCGACGKRLDLVGSFVVGKYSPKRRCDARCTSGIGGYCACECRGANHGRDWNAAYSENSGAIKLAPA